MTGRRAVSMVVAGFFSCLWVLPARESGETPGGTTRGETAEKDGVSWSRADVLYRQGRFAESYEAYRGELWKGVREADLYYNAGNAALRCGRTGEAVLYWLRALRLDPLHADALHNIDWVAKGAAGRPAQRQKNFLARWADVAVSKLGWNGVSAIWLCSVFAAAGAWAASPLPGLGKRRFGPLVARWTAAALAVAWSGVAVSLLAADAADARAVVLSETADVRSGPADDYPVLFRAGRGDVLEVEARWRAYSRVAGPDGKVGWAAARDIECVR